MYNRLNRTEPETQLLPIILNRDSLSVGLVGAGDAYERRAATLADAGLTPLLTGPDGQLPDVRILFIAGLDAVASADLAARARAVGMLVNVEDTPDLCDFHVPAIVRRGDLVLTASTGGQAPGTS